MPFIANALHVWSTEKLKRRRVNGSILEKHCGAVKAVMA
jgi:hypothetical protein